MCEGMAPDAGVVRRIGMAFRLTAPQWQRRAGGNQVLRRPASVDGPAAADAFVGLLGLHARAATKLVQLASRFPCDVSVGREGQTANAKSVMGVLLLCASKGTYLDVIARGDRCEECIGAIGELIAGRFGEPE